jgi:hypothetical protein
MVTSRKPRSPRRRGERRPGETLEQLFQRLMATENIDPWTPLNFTLAEARYVGKRVYETGDPSTPTGEEVMKDFYGDWSEDESND